MKGAFNGMADDKMTKGKPARIILETTIFQGEEVFRNGFDEMGRIVSMNNNYYLRFVEKSEEEDIPTTIKISPEGNVSIIRHATHRMHLVFNDDEDTYTNYQTPAGVLKMRVETERIDLTYQTSPFAGKIEVDYSISAQERVLGSYQIRLRFTT